MSKSGTICIIDDNKSILKTLELLLSDHFKKIITISNPNQIPSVICSEHVDVCLLDMNFSAGINSGNEGLFWLNEIKNLRKETEVVLFTAYAYIDLAVSGIKNGAFDFITKPWDNEKMIETLTKARDLNKKSKRRISNTKEEDYFRGDSETIKRLYSQIEKVAGTDANILITGENGTGKEVIAKYIHKLSSRSDKDLVTVDLGSLTESLFESELFGHVKGAFTDAKGDRAGKFEIASGGSLFLDEIGNLPLHLQSKLLSVLQQRKVIRVGGNTPVDINIRLICATNSNIPEMIREGRFREDLYYRINTITLEIPPLRERREDIIPFAEMFISKYSKQYSKNDITLSRSAIDKLNNYQWPGNVRELQHTIEKAVIMGGNILDEYDFSFEKRIAQEVTAKTCTLEEMEKSAIENAMRECDGNMSLISVKLGITRQTLYNKIKKYNLI